jgi:hypothetical protein
MVQSSLRAGPVGHGATASILEDWIGHRPPILLVSGNEFSFELFGGGV